MYELTKEYETGIDKIDNEHRKLFEIADKCHHIVNGDFYEDKYKEIQSVINELKYYTKFHFSEEEKFMESIKHKQIFTHKLQHDYFIEKIESIDINEVKDNQDKYIADILDFIVIWIKQHILHKDKQYVKDVQ
ncbi:bacteriohemerythrin [Clostridium sp. C8-1-8]|uniref:bacteriohemerythrin n=1 Tax=Clostridium sp. C8-1-8 TaxID=2698831 RepID=UPI00136F2008|nr:bacteriohemerythrin [Clostridium sp. C8-1-8]